ncbi:MAG TPA: HNH endonuclease, partial [Micromonosporaceae bacterium]|nr:HNH endonuclease [Micromonosporaceae bacterium]
DICRLALATDELPTNGGDRPQVVVTVGYDVLAGQLGPGLLDTGETLSCLPRVRPAGEVVRRPPRQALGRRRPDLSQ